MSRRRSAPATYLCIQQSARSLFAAAKCILPPWNTSYLSGSPGIPAVFSRSELLQSVWRYTFDGFDHKVNALINRLRRKIEADPATPKYIKTVWGMGYCFADEKGPAG